MTQNISIAPKKMPVNLEARAREFDEVITKHATDDNHIVMGCLWRDPLRPLAGGDITGDQPLKTTATVEELYAYEDAGMTCGGYLASQSIRYRITGETQAKQNADRAYKGIRYIYELGETRKPGFFPKPYGGRISEQISRDQYLFVMNGLAEYHRIASPDTQTQVGDMLLNMASYWVDINYQTSYFGLESSCHLDDFMGSLYLGIIAIGERLGHSEALQNEYQRLTQQCELDKRMPETLTAKFLRGETYDGAMYYRQSENAMMMKAMAIDDLWESHPEGRDHWRRALQAFWDEDLLAQLDQNTGLNYFVTQFDPSTGKTLLTEPGVIDAIENPLKLAILNWGGLRQHAGSTQVAYAAAVIADRLQMPDAGRIVELVLSKLTLDSFRGLTVPGPHHIPPGHAFECDLFHIGYVSYWLWTYWLARDRGLIG